MFFGSSCGTLRFEGRILIFLFDPSENHSNTHTHRTRLVLQIKDLRSVGNIELTIGPTDSDNFSKFRFVLFLDPPRLDINGHGCIDKHIVHVTLSVLTSTPAVSTSYTPRQAHQEPSRVEVHRPCRHPPLLDKRIGHVNIPAHRQSHRPCHASTSTSISILRVSQARWHSILHASTSTSAQHSPPHLRQAPRPCQHPRASVVSTSSTRSTSTSALSTSSAPSHVCIRQAHKFSSSQCLTTVSVADACTKTSPGNRDASDHK